MYKNKDYRSTVLLGSACALLISACGFFFSGVPAGALPLVTGAALITLFSHYTKQRYCALEKLNDYLTSVLAGQVVPEISDQEEGELSILKTNIYKTTTRLNYQKELLAGDKTRLEQAMADISHQLKTPLTSMMMMNDLLMNEEDEDRRQTFLKTQSAQLDRMNWLIQTLLKIAKLDAGTIVLKQEEISAKELVTAAVKPFEIQMELNQIRLIINQSKKDVPLKVSQNRSEMQPEKTRQGKSGTGISGEDPGSLRFRCDKNWTTEALQNIIKNCCEHMDRGGVLTIETEDTNIFSGISISDTGCGIAGEDLPHIFERFYRGKNSGSDSAGIGLALSKAIIEGQHGEILVDSEEGVGTRFRIRFYKTII
ncbi:MAG: HAMP domain-containing sensor histidine kinase [Eubacteriales bacterium]|nr:HAMP domain-containing sensor histidine kinase [Eubacteriales bacterium]